MLTSDPLVETIYRAGVLSLRDMRVLAGCTGSQVGWRLWAQLVHGGPSRDPPPPLCRGCADGPQA